MTLVVRGSGFSSGRTSLEIAWFFIRRYVVRALLPATTCVQVVKRPCRPHDPILLEMLISASWQASSASGVYGSTCRHTFRQRGRTAVSSCSSASRSPPCARRASSSTSSGVSSSRVMPVLLSPCRPRSHRGGGCVPCTIMPSVSMPARLGRYAVRRRIGSGGFATVWLAYDEQLDSPVAIKVLADNWTEDHHVRQRFLEEGRYLRRVESPHVVSVYDAGELEDGRPYLVMSYADQGTLADRLEVE